MKINLRFVKEKFDNSEDVIHYGKLSTADNLLIVVLVMGIIILILVLKSYYPSVGVG